MATRIRTKTEAIISKILSEHYSERKIAVVDQATIQEKSMLKLFNNVEDYVLKKTPQNANQGFAETQMLYPQVTALIKHWITIPRANYKVGAITAEYATRGLDFAQAAKMLSLTGSKTAVNTAVDVATGMMVSGSLSNKVDFTQVTKDFVFSVLTDKGFRARTINRIMRNFVMPHTSTLNTNDVAELSAQVTLGRGEALNPDQVQIHNVLRSLVLSTLREMIDYAIVTGHHEIFHDVLSSLSLFIMYVNVTESDAVYDTAFPTIAMSGMNPILHAKRIASFKQMAMMFSKVGFSGKAFQGQMTTEMLEDVFRLFPDMFDEHVYTADTIITGDATEINWSRTSFISESSSRFDLAKGVFSDILPSMFKGYVKEVISEIKTLSGVDILIPTMFDELKGSTKGRELFTNLSAQYMGDMNGIGGVSLIVLNPESQNEGPLTELDLITIREVQQFILTNVFPAAETLYHSAIALRSSYDRIFKTLGTPTGGMIPGVSVELELVSSSVKHIVPKFEDMTTFVHAKINERYSAPFVMPGLLIRDDLSQVYVFSDLKWKIVRPDLLALRYARGGDIQGIPNDARINFYPDNNSHDRWAWIAESIPNPTHMHDAAFAFSPIPYNYTYDTVPDFTTNKGIKIDKLMTRSGKIPALGYMTFGETVAAYINAGTVNPRDMALALAGLGYIYVRDKEATKKGAKSWNMIDPECPTIYGMPSVFMKEINFLDINSVVKDVKGIQYIIPAEVNKESDRLITDRSNKEAGVGNVVLVLHKYVPTPRRLRYMIGSIRNGFSLKVPYTSAIYNAILKKSDALIQEEYSKLVAVEGKQDMELPPFVDINATFNKVLTLFFMMPSTGVEKTGEEYFQYLFGEGLEGAFQDYQGFKDYFFEPLLGWSPVVCGYPHFSMSDRFEEHHADHFAEWLRSYTSHTYMNVSQMRDQEEVGILTVTPNNMQMIDMSDEERFWDSFNAGNVNEIATVSRRDRKIERKTNALADDFEVLGSITKVTSDSEGFENILQGNSEPRNTVTKNTIVPLTSDVPEKGLTKKYINRDEINEKDGERSAKTKVITDNIGERKVNEQEFQWEGVDEDGNKIKSVHTPLATQVSLDPLNAEQKEKAKAEIGTGDIQDGDMKSSDETDEDKAKRYKKRK